MDHFIETTALFPMDLGRIYCHGRVWVLGKDCDLRLVGLLCEEGVKIISRTHWLFYCHISEACQGHASSGEVECLGECEIIPGKSLLNW